VVDFPLPDTHNGSIELSLPARPENIAVVRHVLGAVGACLHLDAELVEDMRLAVTEACTNVVRHAYEDGRGPIELFITPEEHGVRVVVADRGRGIGPSPDTRGPGLGLPLIAAIASSLQIDQVSGVGSRITMSFARRPHRDEAAA
jgi:anti-sigma regulatory factor (Ser/Thr protein kinase)